MHSKAGILTLSLLTLVLITAMALTGRDGVAQSSISASVATTMDGSAAWVASESGVKFCRVRAPLTDRPDVSCFSAKEK